MMINDKRKKVWTREISSHCHQIDPNRRYTAASDLDIMIYHDVMVRNSGMDRPAVIRTSGTNRVS